MAVYQTHQYVPPVAPSSSTETNNREGKSGKMEDRSSKQYWDDRWNFSRQQNYDYNSSHQNMFVNQNSIPNNKKSGAASASATTNPQQFASMMSDMFQWMKTYQQQADVMSKRVLSNEDFNALLRPPPPPPLGPKSSKAGSYFSRSKHDEAFQQEFTSSKPTMIESRMAGPSEVRRVAAMDARPSETSAYGWMQSGFDDNQGTKHRSMSQAYEENMLGRVVEQHSRLYNTNPRPSFEAPSAYKAAKETEGDEIPGEYVKSTYPFDMPRSQHGIPLRRGRMEITKQAEDTASRRKCEVKNSHKMHESKMSD